MTRGMPSMVALLGLLAVAGYQNRDKIAEALGMGRASDANEAFNRALRRRPSEEQATIREEENRRLDRLARAVSAGESRTAEDIAKRLRAVERLRTRLMAD